MLRIPFAFSSITYSWRLQVGLGSKQNDHIKAIQFHPRLAQPSILKSVIIYSHHRIRLSNRACDTKNKGVKCDTRAATSIWGPWMNKNLYMTKSIIICNWIRKLKTFSTTITSLLLFSRIKTEYLPKLASINYWKLEQFWKTK